jgi:hypothetical protein
MAIKKPDKCTSPEGYHTAAFAIGFFNAVGSNMGFGPRGDAQQDFSTDLAVSAEAGQQAGDVASVIVGTLEMVGAATGVVAEGLASVPTFGLASVAIAPTAAAGVHGAYTSANGVGIW